MQRTSAEPITAQLLREWPLPLPEKGDKEARGRVLVVAGMRTIPGAAILAATGALRAGAGKLQVAAPESVAVNIAVELPEALVMPFQETDDGAPSLQSVKTVGAYAHEADAVVLGPGMAPNDACTAFVCELVTSLRGSLVLDASALFACKRDNAAVAHMNGNVILTPHAAELSDVTGVAREAIESAPQAHAMEAARRFNAIVALKGQTTHIADPGGRTYVNEFGHIGLATSGSGDVLAGVIGGLLARGTAPLQAAVWGVALHARAGAMLGERMGVGFLAREILAEIPLEMKALSG